MKKVISHLKQGDFFRWSTRTFYNHLKKRSHILRSIQFYYTSKRELQQKYQHYTKADIWLYGCYQSFDSGKPVVLNKDREFNLLKIFKEKIYWPNAEDSRGLGWLWQELYLPYWRNPHSYNHARYKIKPGMVVFDFGSCEGFFAIFAARKGARVFAVEPHPTLAGALRKSFELHALKNIDIIEKAFDNYEGAAYFDLSTQISTSKIVKDKTGIKVEVTTLDSFFNEMNLNKIDFIKLDVEGWEGKIIEGGKETIAKYKPKIAIAVYHYPEQEAEIKNLLSGIRKDYIFKTRGLGFNPLPPLPRPMMLFAY